MKHWFKKAFHYITLIFKKTSLDNVILEYFIDEILNNDYGMERIIYLVKKNSGETITKQQIKDVLYALTNTYDKYF